MLSHKLLGEKFKYFTMVAQRLRMQVESIAFPLLLFLFQPKHVASPPWYSPSSYQLPLVVETTPYPSSPNKYCSSSSLPTIIMYWFAWDAIISFKLILTSNDANENHLISAYSIMSLANRFCASRRDWKWDSFTQRDVAVSVLGCRNPLVGTTLAFLSSLHNSEWS